MQSDDITLSRYRKWNQLSDAYNEFVKFKYKRSDWPLREMRMPFINEANYPSAVHRRRRRTASMTWAQSRV